jgi:hypothetical protein
VPKYDAFGREIGDDPLNALRATPQPEPRPAPEPIAPAPPRPEFVRPRRRRSGGLARLIVVLATLAVAGIALVSVGTSVEGGLDAITPIDTRSDPPAPTGITGDSLIRRANFADAVVTLAGSGLGRPLTMRVAPDRIDATLIAKDGRMHQVQITPGGELNELASSDGAPGRTIPYKAIDPSAPERLVRAGATQTVPAGRIDYLVITAGPQWAAYYRGGRIVIGDGHGRKQRVL